MRGIVKRYHRVVINRRIAANRRQIDNHRGAHPDDFAGREHLYMRHHELLEQRETRA